MVQKRFNKNAMMYFGINNIFNHRDDDRATQERVYRMGLILNLVVETAAKLQLSAKSKDGKTVNGNRPIHLMALMAK